MAVSHGELIKRFPIEAHPVTRTHWCDCHSSFQDQQVLDVSIKPKSARLQVRAIWAGGEPMNRDVMSAVARQPPSAVADRTKVSGRWLATQCRSHLSPGKFPAIGNFTGRAFMSGGFSRGEKLSDRAVCFPPSSHLRTISRPQDSPRSLTDSSNVSNGEVSGMETQDRCLQCEPNSSPIFPIP